MASEYADGYASTYDRLGVPLAPGDGCTLDEVCAAERRLDLSVPAALRSYYLVCGRESRLNHAHNHLLPPHDWTVASGRLVFLLENQSVVVWAADARGADDPQVFQGPSATGTEWYPEHPTCAEFLRVMLHWQAVCGPQALGMTKVSDTLSSRLNEDCAFGGEVGGLLAYSKRQVALCIVPWDDGRRLFVAGARKAAHDVLDSLGVNWEEEFDEW